MLAPVMIAKFGALARHLRKLGARRRLALLLFLPLLFSIATTRAEQPSASPAQPDHGPTPIPLPIIPVEERTTTASVQEIRANVSRDQSSVADFAGNVSKLKSEIESRIGEDMTLLATNPTLDLLPQLESTWQNFADSLSTLDHELADRAASLEKENSRLNRLNETWQVTLGSAKQPSTPQSVLNSVQSIIDSIGPARKATESAQFQVLTVQGDVAEQEARVRTTVASIEQSQSQALKSLLVGDNPPIWSSELGLNKWGTQSGTSFLSEQSQASLAFLQRYAFAFLVLPLLIVVVTVLLQFIRRRLEKVGKQDLQHAMPLLELPVSTALAISLVFLLSIFPQAPRPMQVVLGVVGIVPIVLILRKLIFAGSYPILFAIVILAVLGQFRLGTAAYFPNLSRILFLTQMLFGSCFLIWLLWSWRLPEATVETHGRLWRRIRAIAKIGLIFMPVAFLANSFGYVQLGNLAGLIFLRSVFVAAVLYSVLRIVEGLIIIGLQVRPLGGLRVVNLHRPLLQRRILGVLSLLAFFFWLIVTLNFFGLLAPVTAAGKAVLDASVTIGSLTISVNGILGFAIAVWASFLVSRFIRFLLEEDVYRHFRLAAGVPYAISTMLHYAILLLGFFIALGALGIDLTKITILAGAFSVGVGFGLQNVINNFVSGLILLFERPIKIGDMIDVGGIVGEVRRIGIRASVIRTADGSEVIVPNGSLISSQVTNWTFSDVLRAFEISVNVAEGADLQRVIELLKSAAANQPGIVKEPAPQVYIANFNSETVAFQLRAWTDQQQAWGQLRSDLSLAIKDTLAREKIGTALTGTRALR
ncbi:MAG: mechanosensitive ion channel [Verrucomicrobia bacterium]|nr:mechanosensitive ion channel [Verrucomicrobiota bacterium]